MRIAPGLHDRWKNSPLALSRTRGRPVPAEMLPALSPQPDEIESPRMTTIRKLAAALGVDPRELLED